MIIRETGNPADGAGYLFCSKIDQKLSKIKYGVNKAVKLENEVIPRKIESKCITI